MITGSIKLGNKQLMITSYYRPPNKQDIKYVESTIDDHLLVVLKGLLTCGGKLY
jgi:hypothetical protein